MMKRTQLFLLVGTAALALIARNGSAQNLAKFVAKGTETDISADTAAKIGQACLDYAARNQLKVTFFILDSEGSVVYARRMDGDAPVDGQTALKKAQASLAFRQSTHQMENAAINTAAGEQPAWNAQFQVYSHLLTVRGVHQYPVSGGLPIIVDNEIIGSIGVSGAGVHDEEVANHGLTAIIGPQRPLAKILPEPPLPVKSKD